VAGEDMKRIAVIGCGGAGKSTLACALAARLELPLIHLDAHYWRPGWVPMPMDEWVARQDGLFAGDAWVADGNYHSTLRHRTALADTVVFLDFSTADCLRGVYGRLVRQHGEVRSDMPTGCPERFDLEFLRWVWNFRRVARPPTIEILREFEQNGGRLVTLCDRRAVEGFLDGLA
jgi:adenylate kinase family enzyme